MPEQYRMSNKECPFSRALRIGHSLLDIRYWHSRSRAQPCLAHQPVSRLVGLADPGGDLVWLGRVFQLDADGAVDVKGLDLPQVGREINHAAAGRQVAVDLAVAIAEVDVD